jgi:hypothetical protein
MRRFVRYTTLSLVLLSSAKVMAGNAQAENLYLQDIAFDPSTTVVAAPISILISAQTAVADALDTGKIEDAMAIVHSFNGASDDKDVLRDFTINELNRLKGTLKRIREEDAVELEQLRKEAKKKKVGGAALVAVGGAGALAGAAAGGYAGSQFGAAIAEKQNLPLAEGETSKYVGVKGGAKAVGEKFVGDKKVMGATIGSAVGSIAGGAAIGGGAALVSSGLDADAMIKQIIADQPLIKEQETLTDAAIKALESEAALARVAVRQEVADEVALNVKGKELIAQELITKAAEEAGVKANVTTVKKHVSVKAPAATARRSSAKQTTTRTPQQRTAARGAQKRGGSKAR